MSPLHDPSKKEYARAGAARVHAWTAPRPSLDLSTVDSVAPGYGSPRRRHAVIAGTGRAGTSFLVRFLKACGLDTGATEMPFDARARAGLERNLLDEGAAYVVKDPWLFVVLRSDRP